MKAARFYDKGDIRIEDIPEPTVAPGTVGINVAWCGICGTDLHEFMEGPIFIPPCGHPHHPYRRKASVRDRTLGPLQLGWRPPHPTFRGQ